MLKFFLYLIVRFYQIFISPFFPAVCRHKVSCSNNFLYCIHTYGGVLGFYLGCNQIARCSPWFFNKGGI